MLHPTIDYVGGIHRTIEILLLFVKVYFCGMMNRSIWVFSIFLLKSENCERTYFAKSTNQNACITGMSLNHSATEALISLV